MTSSTNDDKTILLLDVMDTLVWDPFRLVPGALGMTLEEFLQARNPGAWPAFERAQLGEHEFAEQYFADERVLDVGKMRELLRANYRLLDGIESLLGALHAAAVPMYALSNYPVWWEMIEEKFALSRFLSWDFVSCKTGVRKPDPQAYLGPARALGVAPARCLFVDDRHSNCEAAREVGMDAVVFTDAGGLEAALRERGLL